jgi:hypothetical protein
MRRIRWNEQPVTCLDLVRLRTDDRLPAVFARHGAVLVNQILAVGDLSSADHFAGASSDDVEVVSAGVLFGVIPNTVDFGYFLAAGFADSKRISLSISDWR